MAFRKHWQFRAKGSVEENESKLAGTFRFWLYLLIHKQLPQAIQARLFIGFLGRVSPGFPCNYSLYL